MISRDEVAAGMESLPSLSTALADLLDSFDRDGVGISELVDGIGRDQGLSARVLRVANSPFYGRSISGISEAIALIGFYTLTSLVIRISFRDLYRKHQPFENLLWEHSLGVSIAASLITARTKLARPEEALIAGLIHDIGKALLNHSIPGAYSEIIEMTSRDGDPFIEAENRRLGYNHCEAGRDAARAWNLPEPLQAAIAYHHAAEAPGITSAQSRNLCAIVRLADAVCIQSGIGTKGPACVTREDCLSAGLTEDAVKDISRELEEAYERQRRQFED